VLVEEVHCGCGTDAEEGSGAGAAEQGQYGGKI